jgi:nitrite reductase [NAD(P)H] small subunit
MSDWTEVGEVEAIPRLSARVIETDQGNIAVFRTSKDEIFALADHCPHKGGPLSQGIVHGTKVTCPLHNLIMDLTNGEAVAPDEGCAISFPVKVDHGKIFLSLKG